MLTRIDCYTCALKSHHENQITSLPHENVTNVNKHIITTADSKNTNRHLRHDTCMSESNVPPLKLSQVLNRKSAHQHITAAGSSLLSSEKVHAKLTC